MTAVTLEEALPAAQDLAKLKAYAFVRRCRLASHECEDVESHLVLLFVTRWHKYKVERSSVRTFASRVMDSELTSILRYRFAQRRHPREIPVPALSPSPASRQQFRIDFKRSIAPLPEVVRETASTLFSHSDVEAAEVAGCSRQTIHKRKHLIRTALLAAGITAEYFAGEGRRI